MCILLHVIMKYTHVLSIKIWSDKTRICTNYGNILENVKNAIVDAIQTQELVHYGKRETVSLSGSPQFTNIGFDTSFTQ